jgi:hypothetical protein
MRGTTSQVRSQAGRLRLLRGSSSSGRAQYCTASFDVSTALILVPQPWSDIPSLTHVHPRNTHPLAVTKVRLTPPSPRLPKELLPLPLPFPIVRYPRAKASN